MTGDLAKRRANARMRPGDRRRPDFGEHVPQRRREELRGHRVEHDSVREVDEPLFSPAPRFKVAAFMKSSAPRARGTSRATAAAGARRDRDRPRKAGSGRTRRCRRP